MSDKDKPKGKPGRRKTGRTGIRRTIYINPEIDKLVQEEADDESRSFSKMVELILKERYKDKLEPKDKN